MLHIGFYAFKLIRKYNFFKRAFPVLNEAFLRIKANIFQFYKKKYKRLIICHNAI